MLDPERKPDPAGTVEPDSQQLRSEIEILKTVVGELSELKNFYAQLLDTLPIELAVFDASCRYVYVNPLAVADPEMRQWIIGHTNEEYCAHRGVDPDMGRQRTALIQKVLDTGETLHFEESWHTPRKGPRHFERIVAPVTDLEGRVQVLGWGRDITEQREAEKAVRKTQRELEQSLQVKDHFLANMSHEMRTPLNTISGMAHLLLQTQPSSEQLLYLEGIRVASENLLRLVNDVLDIARLGADQVTFRNVPFRIKDNLKALTQTMASGAEAKGLDLSIDLDADVPDLLVGDPVRVNQVLFNLLSNAIKFTEVGIVALEVRLEERLDDQVQLLFVIVDTGIGIPQDKLDDIFERFTQGEGLVRSQTAGGTGLGLAIVRELVERLGGTITVDSRIGEGTTFMVRLPFGMAPDLTLEPVAEEGEISLQGRRILVVEDNPLNRIVARNMLERWGGKVVLAEEGQSALDLLAKAPFDLVLMDLQMPVMDGFEATRRIRADLGLSEQELPILALTASTLADDQARVAAAGLNDVILKPFNPADLQRRIAVYLEPHPPSAPPPQLVDLRLVEANAFGKTDFILRVIDVFLQQVPELMDGMTDALGAADWPGVKFHAHKLKSSAAMFGIGEAVEALRAIEDGADVGACHEAIPGLVERVRGLCQQAVAELEARRRTYEEM